MTDPGGIALGLVLVAIGALKVRYAYRLTRRSERLDAIGSKTPLQEVEPTGWQVTLTRLVNATLALVGAALAIAGWLGMTSIS